MNTLDDGGGTKGRVGYWRETTGDKSESELRREILEQMASNGDDAGDFKWLTTKFDGYEVNNGQMVGVSGSRVEAIRKGRFENEYIAAALNSKETKAASYQEWLEECLEAMNR